MPTRYWCSTAARSSNAAVIPNLWQWAANMPPCGTSRKKPPRRARNSNRWKATPTWYRISPAKPRSRRIDSQTLPLREGRKMRSIFRGGVRSRASHWQRHILFHCRSINELQDTVGVFQKLSIPNPQDAIAAFIQPRCTRIIVQNTIPFSVLAVFQFFYHLRGRTLKVYVLRTDWLLSSIPLFALALFSFQRSHL